MRAAPELAIAVTTAPRPIPTLERSLASLRLAGCELAPLIVADAYPLDGLMRTWARALGSLLAGTKADVLIVAQDDVTWPAGSWGQVATELGSLLARHPDIGYASFYTSTRILDALRAKHGRTPADGWWPTGRLRIRWSGAQCYALPRRAAKQLLRDSTFLRQVETEYKAVDVRVTAALNRIGRPTWTRLPNLIDHHLLGGGGNTSKQPHQWRGSRCAR